MPDASLVERVDDAVTAGLWREGVVVGTQLFQPAVM